MFTSTECGNILQEVLNKEGKPRQNERHPKAATSECLVPKKTTDEDDLPLGSFSIPKV